MTCEEKRLTEKTHLYYPGFDFEIVLPIYPHTLSHLDLSAGSEQLAWGKNQEIMSLKLALKVMI